MADINVEMLKERLYPVAKALFMISEVLVDVSKQHISAERAIDKIRSYMYDTDVIGSRYRVDRLIEDCMEPIISNTFDEEILDILGANMMFPAEFYDENCPQVCVGCSNNPKNGGSGICHCVLPYMQNPTNYTIPVEDSCMANNTGGYVYTTSTKLPDASTPTVDISGAVERTKEYIRR